MNAYDSLRVNDLVFTCDSQTLHLGVVACAINPRNSIYGHRIFSSSNYFMEAMINSYILHGQT